MAGGFKLDRLDHGGIEEVLKSPPVRAVVDGAAQHIAAAVRGQYPGADVVVDSYTTDRAAAAVTIRDARGRLWQVRDGALTRAAASAGLEVTERG